jgi:hypothetical protein
MRSTWKKQKFWKWRTLTNKIIQIDSTCDGLRGNTSQNEKQINFNVFQLIYTQKFVYNNSSQEDSKVIPISKWERFNKCTYNHDNKEIWEEVGRDLKPTKKFKESNVENCANKWRNNKRYCTNPRFILRSKRCYHEVEVWMICMRLTWLCGNFIVPNFWPTRPPHRDWIHMKKITKRLVSHLLSYLLTRWSD